MKVRAGEPFRPSASVWNRLAEISNRSPDRLERDGQRPRRRKFVGKVSGTITAGSESGGTLTAGSGTVNLYRLNDDNELAALTDDSGANYSVTAYNWTETASGSNVYVLVEQDDLGTWWLTNEAC